MKSAFDVSSRPGDSDPALVERKRRSRPDFLPCQTVKPLRLSLFDSEFWWLSKYCQVQQVQQIKHVQDGRGKMERMGRAKERRKEKTRTGRVKTSARPEGILSCVGGDVWNEWHFEKCSVLLELSTTCRHCVVRNFGQCLLLSKQLLVSPARPVKTLGA